MTPSLRRVAWEPCWRVIPTRYPEERLFDRVTDPEDREIVEQLERMTNQRLREEEGEIDVLPPGERAGGKPGGFVMAAFTYPNPDGSRFSDGSFGVYYTGRVLETAVSESRFHREKFMLRTKEAPMRLEMRVLEAHLDAELHDIRGQGKRLPKVYSRTSYAASRELGVRLRQEGSFGVVYDSVRHEGGQCAGVFRPSALSRCRAAGYLSYEWDGEKIAKVYEMREYS